MRRLTDYEELDTLCRNITTSFVHLETRDAYGTEIEQPHLAKWRRGEPDDHAWLAEYLESCAAIVPRAAPAAGRGSCPNR